MISKNKIIKTILLAPLFLYSLNLKSSPSHENGPIEDTDPAATTILAMPGTDRLSTDLEPEIQQASFSLEVDGQRVHLDDSGNGTLNNIAFSIGHQSKPGDRMKMTIAGKDVELSPHTPNIAPIQKAGETVTDLISRIGSKTFYISFTHTWSANLRSLRLGFTNVVFKDDRQEELTFSHPICEHDPTHRLSRVFMEVKSPNGSVLCEYDLTKIPFTREHIHIVNEHYITGIGNVSAVQKVLYSPDCKALVPFRPITIRRDSGETIFWLREPLRGSEFHILNAPRKIIGKYVRLYDRDFLQKTVGRYVFLDENGNLQIANLNHKSAWLIGANETTPHLLQLLSKSGIFITIDNSALMSPHQPQPGYYQLVPISSVEQTFIDLEHVDTKEKVRFSSGRVDRYPKLQVDLAQEVLKGNRAQLSLFTFSELNDCFGGLRFTHSQPETIEERIAHAAAIQDILSLTQNHQITHAVGTVILDEKAVRGFNLYTRLGLHFHPTHLPLSEMDQEIFQATVNALPLSSASPQNYLETLTQYIRQAPCLKSITLGKFFGVVMPSDSWHMIEAYQNMIHPVGSFFNAVAESKTIEAMQLDTMNIPKLIALGVTGKNIRRLISIVRDVKHIVISNVIFEYSRRSIFHSQPLWWSIHHSWIKKLIQISRTSLVTVNMDDAVGVTRSILKALFANPADFTALKRLSAKQIILGSDDEILREVCKHSGAKLFIDQYSIARRFVTGAKDFGGEVNLFQVLAASGIRGLQNQPVTTC